MCMPLRKAWDFRYVDLVEGEVDVDVGGDGEADLADENVIGLKEDVYSID